MGCAWRGGVEDRRVAVGIATTLAVVYWRVFEGSLEPFNLGN